MSHDFVTELRLQLRDAAEREERRGRLRRGLGGLGGPAAAAAMAIALIVVIGGLRWDRGQRPTKPRVVATLTLADNVGSVTAGFGAAWVADTAKGRILRVDPRSRRVTASIPVGANPRITAGAGAVWAVVGTRVDQRLVKVDPRRNRVTARVKLRSDVTAFGVQILRGVPWVIAPEGVLRIDPASGKITRYIPSPVTESFDLTGADDGRWVLTRDHRLLRFDLLTGRRSRELAVRLPNAQGVVPTPEGPVFVTPDGQIARASLADGRLAWRHKVGSGFQVIPLLIGSTLWVHATGNTSGRDHLVAIDLTSGETLSETTLPEFGATASAAVGKELWITTPNGKVMVIKR
jgi:streptogramin lyase